MDDRNVPPRRKHSSESTEHPQGRSSPGSKKLQRGSGPSTKSRQTQVRNSLEDITGHPQGRISPDTIESQEGSEGSPGSIKPQKNRGNATRTKHPQGKSSPGSNTLQRDSGSPAKSRQTKVRNSLEDTGHPQGRISPDIIQPQEGSEGSPGTTKPLKTRGSAAQTRRDTGHPQGRSTPDSTEIPRDITSPDKMARPHVRGTSDSPKPWNSPMRRVQIVPIPLIQIGRGKHHGKHRYKLNEHGVEQYLLSGDGRDLPVAVVSVTGKLRKGKSYILNLILKHAMETCDTLSVDRETFYEAAEEIVKGFQIGDPGGQDAHGIFIWPEIFVRKTGTGEKIGILLMDTQGTMSSHTPMSEWADIFTLSTLFCSTQIYNVSVTISEQQLQNLELFSEYAKHVAQTASTGEKPFDNLLILVRDFKYGEEYGYGIEGGAKFLEAMMIRRKRTLFYFHTNALPEEHREVRENILHSFAKTTCCCLPHPGFEGRKTSLNHSVLMEGMDPRFQKEVTHFVDYLLSPENLTLKKINNELITLSQLYDNLKYWVSLLNHQSFPTLITSYKSTARRNHQYATERALVSYETKMEAVGSTGKKHLERRVMAQAHDLAMEGAIDRFHALAKFGKNDPSMDQYKLKLEGLMAERYKELMVQNQARDAALHLQGKAFFVAVFLACLVLQWLMKQKKFNKKLKRLKPYETSVTTVVLGLTALLVISVGKVALLAIWNWWRNSSFRSWVINK